MPRHFRTFIVMHFFFLILVIVFVVWLLKMVLRFVVLEKDLHGSVNSTVPATLPHISYIFWFLLGLLPSNLIKQSALDVFSCALVTKNATKLYYSFSLAKTIYPDQGKTVNSFSMFPTLFSSTKSFRRLYPVGVLTNAYLSSYNEYLSSLFFCIQSVTPQRPVFISIRARRNCFTRTLLVCWRIFNDKYLFIGVLLSV